MLPLIIGLSGPALTADERAWIASARPAGFILFARNADNPVQLRALTDALRALTARDDVPILIDQEGGRVARLAPPHWPAFPAAAAFGAVYRRAPATAIAAARHNGLALAAVLADAGISVNCAPMLDVAQPDADKVIGDRAFGSDPLQVAALGRALLDGMVAGGVQGVVKHLPGHGRARVDSHNAMPVVAADAAALAADLAPFVALKSAAIAMTAHINYPVWDAAAPATCSAAVIANIIRGQIGFDGLLMSDDLAMGALTGDAAARARAALDAGCDLAMHCHAAAAELDAVAAAVPDMTAAARLRLDRAMAPTWPRTGHGPSGADHAAARDALLAAAGG